MTATELTLLIHTAATWYMVGVIWFVQWVHYTLFNHIGEEFFIEYQLAHMQRTSHVVLMAMFIEAGTAGLLLLSPPQGVSFAVALAGMLMIGVIWLSTLFLQVPRHDRLTRGYDEIIYLELLRTNWLRTLLWSTRGLLVLWMLAQMVSAA